MGDILTWHNGHCYFKVEERDGEYWLVDCSTEVIGQEYLLDEGEIEDPFRLEKNLDSHWKKVDKNDPTRTPPMEIECECCDTVVGEFDVDTGRFTWFINCAQHEEPEEGYVRAWCRKCYPERETKKKLAPMRSQVEEYFFERYAKADFRVTPGHWPDFQSKEEVDEWFKSIEETIEKFVNAKEKTCDDASDRQV